MFDTYSNKVIAIKLYTHVNSKFPLIILLKSTWIMVSLEKYHSRFSSVVAQRREIPNKPPMVVFARFCKNHDRESYLKKPQRWQVIPHQGSKQLCNTEVLYENETNAICNKFVLNALLYSIMHTRIWYFYYKFVKRDHDLV